MKCILYMCTFLLYGAIPPLYAQETYSIGQYRLVRSHYTTDFIGSVSAQKIIFEYYPEFRINLSQVQGYWGKRYGLKRDKDGIDADFQIGIYPSVEEAEEAVLGYLNSVPAYWINGYKDEKAFGDNYWYAEVKYDGEESPRIYATVFQRKNIFILMSNGAFHSKNYFDLFPVARSIDSLVVNGSPWIGLSDILDPPVVSSIQLSKQELKLNEMAVMTVKAYDPKGKKIEYARSPGIMKNADDPANVFRIYASRDNWGEPFYGTHIIEAWVVNEDNFVSRKFATQITFSPPPR